MNRIRKSNEDGDTPPRKTLRRNWSHVLPVAFLCGAVFLFFGRILAGPGELYGSDASLYFIPLKQFIYDFFHERGALPFWNPYIFSGIPLVTNIQASMFYPGGVLYYLLPSDSAYTWSSMLHCMLGGLSMFALMRSLALSAPAAVLSSIVFCFNGFFLGHLYAGHLTFVHTYVWIPLVFLFAHRFCVFFRISDLLCAGLVLGVQALGGFPQIAFYTALLVLGYGAYRGTRLLWRKEFKTALLMGLGISCILALGGALAAVQVLPTWEFTGLSTRAGGLSYEFATYDSLHPKELLSFIIPDIYGSAIDGTYWRTKETWHFWETCGYVGMLPLFLIFIRRQSGESSAWLNGFFIVALVLALFLALGKYNPLYPWIAQLPGFRSFRIPAQIIFLYVFAMSVLAGLGLERIRRDKVRLHPSCGLLWIPLGIVLVLALIGFQAFPLESYSHLFKSLATGSVTHANLEALPQRTWGGVFRGAILFGACLIILAARMSNRLSWPSAAALSIFLVVTDLYMFGNEFIQPYRYESPQAEARLASRLPRSPEQGRVLTLPGSLKVGDSIRHQFPSVLGYDPLLLRRYVYWIQKSQGLARDDHVVILQDVPRPEDKLMKLLHLKWVVAGERIFSLKNDIPYAVFAAERTVRSGEDVLEAVRSPGFDPTRSVVLESEADALLVPETGPGRVQGMFEVRSYENERIRIRASVDRPAYMVLSEVHYPGWKARVDGVTTPILRANYLFRAVPLQAGDHEVELTFVSWPFRLGAGISFATLLVVAGIFLRERIRRLGSR